MPSKRAAILAGVGVALLVVAAVVALRPKAVESDGTLRWWRFTVECLRRETQTLVLAPDRATAIARKCQDECGALEGTARHQRCEGECSAGWQRGQGSGGVWAHERYCQYRVEREDWP